MIDDDIIFLGSTNPHSPFLATRPAQRPVTGVSLHVEKQGASDGYEMHFRRAKTTVVYIGRRSGADADPSSEDGDELESAMFRCAVVSRRHAKIAFSDSGNVYLIDLNSHHGTHIRKPADKFSKMIKPETPTLLVDGDVVTFGKSVGKGEDAVPPITARIELLYGGCEIPSASFKPLIVPGSSPSSLSDRSIVKSPSGRYGVKGTPSSSSDESSSNIYSDIEEIPAPAFKKSLHPAPISQSTNSPSQAQVPPSQSSFGSAINALRRLLPPSQPIPLAIVPRLPSVTEIVERPLSQMSSFFFFGHESPSSPPRSPISLGEMSRQLSTSGFAVDLQHPQPVGFDASQHDIYEEANDNRYNRCGGPSNNVVDDDNDSARKVSNDDAHSSHSSNSSSSSSNSEHSDSNSSRSRSNSPMDLASPSPAPDLLLSRPLSVPPQPPQLPQLQLPIPMHPINPIPPVSRVYHQHISGPAPPPPHIFAPMRLYPPGYIQQQQHHQHQYADGPMFGCGPYVCPGPMPFSTRMDGTWTADPDIPVVNSPEEKEEEIEAAANGRVAEDAEAKASAEAENDDASLSADERAAHEAQMEDMDERLLNLQSTVGRLQSSRRKYKSKFNANVALLSTKLSQFDDRLGEVNAEYTMLFDIVEGMHRADVPDLQSQMEGVLERVEELEERDRERREEEGEEEEEKGEMDERSDDVLMEKEKEQEVKQGVKTLRALVDEMKLFRETSQRQIAEDLAAIKALREEAAAKAASFTVDNSNVSDNQTPVLPSLKRKRDDIDENEEASEGSSDVTVVTVNTKDTAAMDVFTTPSAAMALESIVAPPPRKRARRVGSILAQTATAVTIGAVVTWSALAFS